MYTISEVAKLLSVSRQTIYNKIDKENLHTFLQDTDKGKVINQEGFEVLKNLMASPIFTVHSQSKNVNESKYIDSLIDSQKAENEHLKTIIAEQSKQIDNLTALLQNSQVLQKQHQDKIFLLEQPKQEQKKSFWDRFKI